MTELTQFTVEQLQAEIELRATLSTYSTAITAFDDAYLQVHMGPSDDDIRCGLIAAWPHMPETVKLQQRVAEMEKERETIFKHPNINNEAQHTSPLRRWGITGYEINPKDGTAVVIDRYGRIEVPLTVVTWLSQYTW